MNFLKKQVFTTRKFNLFVDGLVFGFGFILAVIFCSAFWS